MCPAITFLLKKWPVAVKRLGRPDVKQRHTEGLHLCIYHMQSYSFHIQFVSLFSSTHYSRLQFLELKQILMFRDSITCSSQKHDYSWFGKLIYCTMVSVIVTNLCSKHFFRIFVAFDEQNSFYFRSKICSMKIFTEIFIFFLFDI